MNVVFLVFNRPKLTVKVFARIAQAKPDKLFLVADGPQASCLDDIEKVRQVREIVSRVDWPCEVFHAYSEVNLGCKRRVASGLDWTFSLVEDAIILEDDCLPDPSFFSFCQELLERYRDDERIMQIGGSDFLRGKRKFRSSYYFSKYAHMWGWATWRRAWKHYDVDMQTWPEFRDSGKFTMVCPDPAESSYWIRGFDLVHKGEFDTWDFQWQYACWVRHGLSVLPAVNLVTNIGAGTDATHTTSNEWYMGLPSGSIGMLVHPDCILEDKKADAITFKTRFQSMETPWWLRLLRVVGSKWTYGALIRKTPLLGQLWAKWRAGRDKPKL